MAGDNLVSLALFVVEEIGLFSTTTFSLQHWSKDWLRKRQDYSHINLMKELQLEKDDWFN